MTVQVLLGSKSFDIKVKLTSEYSQTLSLQLPTSQLMSNMKLNVHSILGPFCVQYPDLCFYATSRMSPQYETKFTTTELLDILAEWANTETSRQLGDLSDAYWLAQCIIKSEQSRVGDMEHESEKLLNCHLLIQEVPNVSLNGSPNSPFWTKIARVIDAVKNDVKCIQSSSDAIDQVPELALACSE